MYLLYESYTDDCRNLKDLSVNTRLVALYNNKERAVMEYKDYLEKTITQSDGEYDWFVQELDLDLLENKNILGACRVYNEGIEVYNDYYMIVLEEIKEVIRDDK